MRSQFGPAWFLHVRVAPRVASDADFEGAFKRWGVIFILVQNLQYTCTWNSTRNGGRVHPWLALAKMKRYNEHCRRSRSYWYCSNKLGLCWKEKSLSLRKELFNRRKQMTRGRGQRIQATSTLLPWWMCHLESHSSVKHVSHVLKWVDM
jgi:hypothetical protein